ncbi:MAG: hypothetical protein K6F09_04755, partial [Clostridiales bacterium]|nr:hypothetical protein [Clostridiales bacterium]
INKNRDCLSGEIRKTALFRFNIEKWVLNYDPFLAVFSPSTYLYTPIGRRKRRLHLNATARLLLCFTIRKQLFLEIHQPSGYNKE